MMDAGKNFKNKLLELLAITIVLAACSAQPAVPATMPAGPDVVWDLVVIGDSGMWGLGEALAAQIEEDVNVQVELHEWVYGNYSAGRALQEVEAEGLSALLKDAEYVVFWANPMDSENPDVPIDDLACWQPGGTVGSCPPEGYTLFTADLETMYARIFELRDGQPTIVRGLDLYWPLVSNWIIQDKFEACTVCWEVLSDATRQAAEAYNVPFLSRYNAFNGPNHDEDPREKGLIAADGMHPSELAAEYTADLLSEMGYEPVTPP
jgi:hypothetical protein